MSIESQISKMTGLTSVKTWPWHGKPLSRLNDLTIPFPFCFRSWLDVDCAILAASIDECTYSDSEYIRECKKWFMNVSLEDNLRFVMGHIFTLESYPWQGHPASIGMSEDIIFDHLRNMSHLYMDSDTSYSNDQNRRFAKRNYDCILLVDKIINEALDNIALTSSILYIRECKKWLIDNPMTF